jgi:hypothetical protein
MRTFLVTTAALTSALALSACGGGDEKASTTTATAATEAAATPATVLSCLKAAGLEAKDQSSSTGEKIGIDYPAGRLLISFEETPLDAKTYASVAEANGDTAIVKGSIVITIPVDPTAEAARAAVEKCVAPA